MASIQKEKKEKMVRSEFVRYIWNLSCMLHAGLLDSGRQKGLCPFLDWVQYLYQPNRVITTVHTQKKPQKHNK